MTARDRVLDWMEEEARAGRYGYAWNAPAWSEYLQETGKTPTAQGAIGGTAPVSYAGTYSDPTEPNHPLTGEARKRSPGSSPSDYLGKK